jgi:hypothetical protein
VVRVFCACEDGKVKVHDSIDFSKMGEMTPGGAGGGAVQCVAVNVNDGLVLSGGSDCMVNVFGK